MGLFDLLSGDGQIGPEHFAHDPDTRSQLPIDGAAESPKITRSNTATSKGPFSRASMAGGRSSYGTATIGRPRVSIPRARHCIGVRSTSSWRASGCTASGCSAERVCL